MEQLAQHLKRRPVKEAISVMLDPEVVAKIDQLAADQGLTRSKVIRALLALGVSKLQ